MAEHLNSYEFVGREQEVAFIRFRRPRMSSTTNNKHTRMEGFTSLPENKNPQKRTRRYVDEKSERTSTSGYKPSIPYQFDRYAHLLIHDEIRYITDHDMTGADAEAEIVIVDGATSAGDGKFNAYRRNFSVCPETKGDTTDAMTYSGTFEANGDVSPCKVTLDSNDISKAMQIVELEDVTSTSAASEGGA